VTCRVREPADGPRPRVVASDYQIALHHPAPAAFREDGAPEDLASTGLSGPDRAPRFEASSPRRARRRAICSPSRRREHRWEHRVLHPVGSAPRRTRSERLAIVRGDPDRADNGLTKRTVVNAPLRRGNARACCGLNFAAVHAQRRVGVGGLCPLAAFVIAILAPWKWKGWHTSAIQFDAVIHIDETTRSRPLERTSEWGTGELPVTTRGASDGLPWRSRGSPPPPACRTRSWAHRSG
jgi:hypothetical protein